MAAETCSDFNTLWPRCAAALIYANLILAKSIAMPRQVNATYSSEGRNALDSGPANHSVRIAS
jgi:hypothetical protein